MVVEPAAGSCLSTLPITFIAAPQLVGDEDNSQARLQLLSRSIAALLFSANPSVRPSSHFDAQNQQC
jgi:hypothetical protein